MEKEQYSKGYVCRDDGWWLSDSEEEFGFWVNWKVKSLLHQEKSAFQEISIIETEGFGRALVLDGIVQTTERDGWIYNEMISHIPLAAHPEPSDVCIIGGGDCGAVREVVKYPSVKRVDMVEIDPRVVHVSRKYLPSIAGEGDLDPRVHFVFEDGADFVKEKKGNTTCLSSIRRTPWARRKYCLKNLFIGTFTGRSKTTESWFARASRPFFTRMC